MATKLTGKARSGKARWRKTTKKQRSEAMRQVAAAQWEGTTAAERKKMTAHLSGNRWAGTTAAERSAHARMMAKQSSGRWNPDRCPCGAMTRDRAAKRGHKCSGPDSENRTTT